MSRAALHAAALGRKRRSSVLLSVDFTALAAGAVASLTGGLALSRASVATVQTGTQTLVTAGIGNDVARAGRRLDTDPVALVLEETRTNLIPNCRAIDAGTWTAGGSVVTTADVGAGPDGSALADRCQVSSGGFSRYWSAATAGTHTGSCWVRASSGTSTYQPLVSNTNTVTAVGGTCDTTWRRVAPAPNAHASDAFVAFIPEDGRDWHTSGGVVAGARDVWTDLHQLESGRWASECIVTAGASATRAGERLYDPTGSRWVSGGRLSLEVRFRAKAARSDYASALRIWTSGSDYCELAPATGLVTVSIGGTTVTSAVGAQWVQYDTVELFVAAGNGATLVSYRVNGGDAVPLAFPSGGTLGALTVAGALDLLCSGTGSQLSAWVETIRAYRLGRAPAWATSQPLGALLGIVLGDSTSAAYLGQAATASLLYSAAHPRAGSVVSLANPGDTLDNQQATWDASAFKSGAGLRWAFVLCGINNLGATPFQDAATVLAKLNSLCSDIRAANPGIKIAVMQVLPCLQRMKDLFPTTYATEYAAWQALNASILAGGVTAADVALPYPPAANDGSDNLAALFDVGDHIHETTALRQLIANAVDAQLVIWGFA